MSNEPNSVDLSRAPVRARRIVITVAQITMLALMPYSAHSDVSVAGPAGSLFSLRGFGTVALCLAERKRPWPGGDCRQRSDFP